MLSSVGAGGLELAQNVATSGYFPFQRVCRIEKSERQYERQTTTKPSRKMLNIAIHSESFFLQGVVVRLSLTSLRKGGSAPKGGARSTVWFACAASETLGNMFFTYDLLMVRQSIPIWYTIIYLILLCYHGEPLVQRQCVWRRFPQTQKRRERS